MVYTGGRSTGPARPQRIGQRRLVVKAVVSAGESPVETITAWRLICAWSGFVVGHNYIVDNGVNAMVEQVHMPPFVGNHIVHALASGMARCLQRIACEIAQTGCSVAYSHENGVGRIAKMPDIFSVLRESGRLGKVEPLGG